MNEPSDLELMAYFDGELDAERHAEVERFVERTSAARSKMRGLSLGGAMLRARAEEATPAVDAIASAVMAQIASGSAGATPADRAGDVVPLAPVKAPAPPANDNSRRVLWLASLAVAAAGALFAWGRGGDLSSGSTVADARHATTAAAALSGASSAEEAASANAEPGGGAAPGSTGPAEAEAAAPTHGVEVAQVEFGARTGSIFYVANEDVPSNSTTTVVWLADDAAGEE